MATAPRPGANSRKYVPASVKEASSHLASTNHGGHFGHETGAYAFRRKSASGPPVPPRSKIGGPSNDSDAGPRRTGVGGRKGIFAAIAAFETVEGNAPRVLPSTPQHQNSKYMLPSEKMNAHRNAFANNGSTSRQPSRNYVEEGVDEDLPSGDVSSASAMIERADSGHASTSASVATGVAERDETPIKRRSSLVEKATNALELKTGVGALARRVLIGPS